MSCTLFISDLHLDADRPASTQLFTGFLAGRAVDADALYILGDLFEAWVGDDDDSPLARTVCDALRGCVSTGTAIYLMHGNRDFLLGKRFAEQSGCSLLPDPSVIDLYGKPVLLMHGDMLCTDDTDYQAWRRRVRNPQWQQMFLSQSLIERRQQARQLRAASAQEKQQKPAAIMDVSPQAVLRSMSEHGVTQLIHGHTHRPGIHEISINDLPAQRLVPGDWYENGSVLECDAGGCRLQSLSVAG